MSPLPARVLSNLTLPAPEGVSIRTFGEYLAAAGGARPDPGRRALKEILPLIPAAERPDALVIASPEYLPVPLDLAAFPGPKILLITDWNVCLRFLPDLCPLFDFCFTDWPGYRLLRRAGIGNVFHQPLFGHDPGAFRDLGSERNLDVSFCGNLNPSLHGERNRLVARVAKWAGARPAHLRQAFGGAYVEVLNRSRLVFNYSIRGEANMRLFEAMACGAAPLVEASNQEVPILFQEGKHYFRYEPDRIEARLEELLAHPSRIAEVASEGKAAVARHAKVEQVRSLLGTVAREAPGNRNVTPSPDGIRACLKLRLLGSDYTIPEALAEIQALAGTVAGLEPETVPGVLMTLIEEGSGPLPAAEAMLERLLADGRQPPVVAAFLRMRLATRRGRWPEVLEHAGACLESLGALGAPAVETPEARLARLRGLYGRYYPPVHLGRGFNTDINRSFREDLAATSGPPSAPAARPGWGNYVRLLGAHCLRAQAVALTALGRPAEAWDRVAAIPPDTFASVDARACRIAVLGSLGDLAGQAREWVAAFRERPLDTAVWDGAVEALTRAGASTAVTGFLEELLTLALKLLPEDQVARVRERLEWVRSVRAEA